MEKILIIGAGGHAKSVIDVVESTKKYKIIGLIDNNTKINNKKIFKYEILGSNKDLKIMRKTCKFAIVGIGQIKSAQKRINNFELLKKLRFQIPKIFSTTSYISKNTIVGDGTVIFHGVYVNAGASIGDNCIINTRSIIEHDVKIGNHCHVSTGATLNGGVILGDNSFVGSGAVIKENVKIGKNCIVAAKSFLKKDLEDNKIYNP
tara:strand:- start:516 stop:1130 length:615 start_codon:yes stop_codon:yes gene_type:complete